MSSFGSSMRSWKSSMLSNTTARPLCFISLGVAAEGLMMAPSGADKWKYGFGRAADRGVDAARVLDRRSRQDLLEAEALPDHFHDAPSRRAREHVAARIDRGDRRVPGEAEPERLDHSGHGGRRPHGHAVTVRAVHARLGLVEFLDRDLSGAQLLGHRPHVGSRADLFVAILVREH